MEINEFKKMVGGEEKNTIAVDFDGVIHKNSKGFHDGTIYDKPIEGVKKGLEYLSKSYRLVIYSCKANPDRPKIDNKTGVELIWDWLEKHNLKNYIDDKAIMFLNWKMVMGVISA